jgi:CxxC motif-containing protein
MKTLTCIVCPKGCTLNVDADKKEVTGQGCSRGRDYGIAEVTNPTRVLTTTVAIDNALHPRLPVKTAAPIPKGKLREAMTLIDTIRVTAPVRLGDVIYPNLLDTGVDLVACSTM